MKIETKLIIGTAICKFIYFLILAAIGVIITYYIGQLYNYDKVICLLSAFIIAYPLSMMYTRFSQHINDVIELGFQCGGRFNPVSTDEDFRNVVMERDITDYDLYVYNDIKAHLDVFRAIRDKHIRLIIIEKEEEEDNG